MEKGKCRLESDINQKGNFYFLGPDGTWASEYVYNVAENADVCARSCDANADRCKGFHLYREGHEEPTGECVF